MWRNLFHKLSGLIVLAGILFLSSCWRAVTGTGPVIVETRSIPIFSELSLNIPATVTLVISDSVSCAITAQKNISDLIEIEKKGDGLRITSKKDFRTKNPVEIILSSPGIERLAVNGSGDMQVINTVKGDRLKIYINGSGTITLAAQVEELLSEINGSGELKLSGKAESHDAEINGSGNLKSFDLAVDKCEIELTGSGEAQIHANEELKATLAGSGNIIYRGTPTVRSEINGSGNISKSN